MNETEKKKKKRGQFAKTCKIDVKHYSLSPALSFKNLQGVNDGNESSLLSLRQLQQKH